MRKKLIAVSLILLAGALGLYFGVRPVYRHIKEQRLASQAKRFQAKGDYANASLCARKLFLANRSNVDACRIMAELAELARSPHALEWRQRMVELQPTVENKLLYAAAALRAQGPPFPLATQILDDLTNSAQGLVSYQVLAAELALKLNRPQLAEKHFEEAARLAPNSELYQLNVAVLRLRSTNATQAAVARKTIEGLCGSTNVGPVALRWLVAEDYLRKNYASAEQFSRKLVADRYATVNDRLQHLDILRETKQPEAEAYLESLKQSCATNGLSAYLLSAWLISHSQAEDAMRWLRALPPKARAAQPVPLALVDCYLAKGDWAGLDFYLQTQKWGDLEFLRLAFSSHAATERHEDSVAQTRWLMALQATQDRFGALMALLNLTTTWQASQAREELLWKIAQRFPKERWAFQQLEFINLRTGDTRDLNKIYAAMATMNGKDFAARNNVAATAMLLGINLSQAFTQARELYSQHAEETVVASTYAYSLHLQRRTKQGLAILEKFKPEQLETPTLALYYGLLLSADGQPGKAGKYLQIAQNAKSAPLLPEEKQLLIAALAKTR